MHDATTAPIPLKCWICCAMAVLFLHRQLPAQSPYRLSPADYALVGGGLALAATGHVLVTQVQPYSAVVTLNPNPLPGFDRIATRYWSPAAQWISHGTVGLAALGSGSLLFIPKTRSNLLPIALMGLETLLITDGLTQGTKALVQRPRPFMYNPSAPPEPKMERGARLSFFSGHTASVAACSFFTAQVIHDHFPEAKWRRWVWMGAAALPAATAYLRVRGGKHFPSDVLTGYLVGAGLGLLIPALHRDSEGLERVSVYPANAGVGIRVSF